MPSLKKPSTDTLTFKVAESDQEFEAIHHLNYQTFVQEIPQHQPSADQRLVDKFHHQNTYLICLRDRELLGMVAVRDQRPFSLEKKIEHFETHLPPHESICEVRLLSVAPSVRRTSVVAGLMRLLADHVEQNNYDVGVISGTVRQLKLYRHLGFVPFGPTVGTADALYQPMYMTAESLQRTRANSKALSPSRAKADNGVNLLPGPCTLSSEVRKALSAQPISHRSGTFKTLFTHLQQQLCSLTHAKHVYILPGSGTLANDAIAAQLCGEGKGLILVNGEFGRRLIEHATSAGLEFDTHTVPDGEGFDYHQIPSAEWTWMVHLETSTGVLNTPECLPATKQIIDAVSAIGVTAVDLSDTYLASGVSGKGLNAPPGLALIFANHEPSARKAPCALDLHACATADGIPHTISSNHVAALSTSLDEINFDQRFEQIAEIGTALRRAFTRYAIGDPANTSPAVISLQIPPHLDARKLGETLEAQKIFVSYRSRYLLRANQIQLCLMSENDVPTEQVIHALRALLEN